MILIDFFKEEEKTALTDNYIIRHRNYDFLLTYDILDGTWYLDCITECFKPNFEYNIDEFVRFVKTEPIEINKNMVEMLIEDYYLLGRTFYMRKGFFDEFVVIDNSCNECYVESFNSITLAMLWLHKGYVTTGHNDLFDPETEIF